MQADEFEKKIQNKMEGFGLVPDREVWRQVALKIENKKKKRRIIFYWLFIGFVLLAVTSSHWIINNDNDRKAQVNNEASVKENYKAKQSSNNRVKSLNRIKKAPFVKITNYAKKDAAKHIKVSEAKNRAFTATKYARITNEELNTEKVKQPQKAYKAQKESGKILPPHKFYNPNAAAKVETDVEDNKIIDRKQNPKDISANTIVKETTGAKRQISKKLIFGITAYSGISNNLSGLLSMQKNYVQDYSSGVSGGNYSVTNTSDDAKSGFSFGLGVFVRKEISRKISLSAGVDYHLYKVKSAVGKPVNSPTGFYDPAQIATGLNRYYNAGNSVNYLNKYQFIQLPVNLEFQINKNHYKPLVVSAGISPGWLVSSNALYANTERNVYYIDKEKFHHFQLSAQTAFLFAVKASHGFLLTAGPAAQYAFTNATKAANVDQHLFFAGLKATIILK